MALGRSKTLRRFLPSSPKRDESPSPPSTPPSNSSGFPSSNPYLPFTPPRRQSSLKHHKSSPSLDKALISAPLPLFPPSPASPPTIAAVPLAKTPSNTSSRPSHSREASAGSELAAQERGKGMSEASRELRELRAQREAADEMYWRVKGMGWGSGIGGGKGPEAGSAAPRNFGEPF